MINVEFELRKASITALMASAKLAEVGGRVFADLPQGIEMPESPYIVLGNWVTTSQDAECIDGYLVQMSFDIYSYGPNEHGTDALVSKLASGLRQELKTEEFELSAEHTAAISHRATRYFKENGGALNRANVAMEASFDEFQD